MAIHGWVDNAGSFDNLAPLLKNSSILAIDLPGHGLSSWFPRGMQYNNITSVQAMRIVVKHFGWHKVKLLGHSMGGLLCYNYAYLYPEEVKFVISIEAVTYGTQGAVKHANKQAKAIDKLIQFEKKCIGDRPSYPEEVAIEKQIKAMVPASLDVPTTKILMLRGAKKNNDGTYYCAHDYRLTFERFSANYSAEDIKELSSRITCPYLSIKASHTPYSHLEKYWTETAEVMSATNKEFRLVPLEGGHHLHMTKPKIVANELNPFLEKYNV